MDLELSKIALMEEELGPKYFSWVKHHRNLTEFFCSNEKRSQHKTLDHESIKQTVFYRDKGCMIQF